MKNTAVIIPSLNPNENLEKVVTSIIDEGFSDIILVDDGSKDENKKFFPQSPYVTKLVHDKNRGKGAALKTAMKYVLENRPDCIGVVTCDGDGQHLAKDVKSVCECMKNTGAFVLGVRDFSGDDVPKKSRVGNRLSSFFLALCCGKYISDTQTGLRAIPMSILDKMCQIDGDRFEYETNVLLELKAIRAELCEVKIDTVYLDENKGTHFHPVKDTLRIFSRIIKYLFSSLAAFIADIGIFTILTKLFSLGIMTSTVVARVVSSAINFIINKKVVFHSGETYKKTLVKYYALAIPVMFVSGFSVKGLSILLGTSDGSIILTFIKIVVDFILFILNYNIQKKWIFKK